MFIWLRGRVAKVVEYYTGNKHVFQLRFQVALKNCLCESLLLQQEWHRNQKNLFDFTHTTAVHIFVGRSKKLPTTTDY